MTTIFWKRLFKCLPASATSHPAFLKQDYNLSASSTSKSLSTDPSMGSSSSYDSDNDTDSPPDFSTIIASQRFFCSSPGRSNSITESLYTASTGNSQAVLVSGGIAVKKYSPDPYTDFKFSMQEMIEAREVTDVRANWDYLDELLSCYLTLNPEHAHKFIISAFADIVISLLLTSSSPESGNH